MLDMIGVGPFITLPLILAAMGGPQAMLGWILGAGLRCATAWSGPNWARPCPRRAARTPSCAGSTRVRTGTRKLGRFLAFLFIFQLSFSAPLSVASGCIGLSQYAAYLWPSLAGHAASRIVHIGPYSAGVSAGPRDAGRDSGGAAGGDSALPRADRPAGCDRGDVVFGNGADRVDRVDRRSCTDISARRSPSRRARFI